MRASILTCLLIAILAGVFGSGCRQLSPAETAKGSALISGAVYLRTLQEQGKLPGLATNEHWSMHSVPVPETNSIENATFKVLSKAQPKSVFWYLVKRNQDRQWELVDAWKTDPDGNREQLLNRSPDANK